MMYTKQFGCVMNYFLNTLFVSSNIKERIATEAKRSFYHTSQQIKDRQQYRGCGKLVDFFLSGFEHCIYHNDTNMYIHIIFIKIMFFNKLFA